MNGLMAGLVVFAMCAACSGKVEVGAAQGSGAAGSGGGAASGGAGGTCAASGSGGSCTGASTGSGGAAGSTSASTGGGEIMRTCWGHLFECGDGSDNDGDGLTDAADPECIGVCDNTEDSYPAPMPDGMWGCVADCYFDEDSSPDDDCHWSYRCDPHEVPPDYYPYPSSQCAYDPQAPIAGTTASCADLQAAQSAACMDFCGPLTPNGCDCFGCCELPAGSGNFVWLGSLDSNGTATCQLAVALDPTKCHPCQPVTGCLNPCDSCELCLGRTTLSPGCAIQTCAGAAPCGLPGQSYCPAGFYCVTGCCQPGLP